MDTVAKDILDSAIGGADPIEQGMDVDKARSMAMEADKDFDESLNPITFSVKEVEERSGDFGDFYMIKLVATGTSTGKFIGKNTTIFMDKYVGTTKQYANLRIKDQIELTDLFKDQTGVDIWTSRHPDPTPLAGSSFQADVFYIKREGKRPILKLKRARL
jgi:hypothetical protein